MTHEMKRAATNIAMKAALAMVQVDKDGGDYIDQLSEAMKYIGENRLAYSIWDKLMQSNAFVLELVNKTGSLK